MRNILISFGGQAETKNLREAQEYKSLGRNFQTKPYQTVRNNSMIILRSDPGICGTRTQWLEVYRIDLDPKFRNKKILKKNKKHENFKCLIVISFHQKFLWVNLFHKPISKLFPIALIFVTRAQIRGRLSLLLFRPSLPLIYKTQTSWNC